MKNKVNWVRASVSVCTVYSSSQTYNFCFCCFWTRTMDLNMIYLKKNISKWSCMSASLSVCQCKVDKTTAVLIEPAQLVFKKPLTSCLFHLNEWHSKCWWSLHVGRSRIGTVSIWLCINVQDNYVEMELTTSNESNNQWGPQHKVHFNTDSWRKHWMTSTTNSDRFTLTGSFIWTKQHLFWHLLWSWWVSIHRPCFDAHGDTVQLIRQTGLCWARSTLRGLWWHRGGSLFRQFIVDTTETIPLYNGRKLLLL